MSMRSPPFWPFLDGVSLHRRVLAHPQHCFPFWGLSANVFSLTGYDRLSTAFIKEQTGWIVFHSPTAQKSIKTKHLQRNFLKIFQTGTCPSAPSGGNVYIFISIRRCCMYANNILFPQLSFKNLRNYSILKLLSRSMWRSTTRSRFRLVISKYDLKDGNLVAFLSFLFFVQKISKKIGESHFSIVKQQQETGYWRDSWADKWCNFNPFFATTLLFT